MHTHSLVGICCHPSHHLEETLDFWLSSELPDNGLADWPKSSFGTHEPQHEKMHLLVCVPREDKSNWASAQSDQSSLATWRNFASLAIQNAPCDDSDQTAWMRLIWIFAGCTCLKVCFLILWLIWYCFHVKTQLYISSNYKSLKVQFYSNSSLAGVGLCCSYTNLMTKWEYVKKTCLNWTACVHSGQGMCRLHL